MPAITQARCKCAANAMSQLEDAKKTKSQMMTEARIAITVQYAAEFAKASRPIRCITPEFRGDGRLYGRRPLE